MKLLYKTVKVIYNGHTEQYEVWCRGWLPWTWKQHSTYQIGKHFSDMSARDLAIKRAEGLLNTVEVWKQSNVIYY